MEELIWINGEVMPLVEARIGVEDRGFQFADGVYEVIRVYGGRAFALAEHLARLERSCAGISLAMPMSADELAGHIQRLIVRAALRDGMIYLQLTRGQAPRNHVFGQCTPTLLFYARELPPVPLAAESPGLKLISVNDERWHRCWIKSIALLPNVLAKNQAVAAGADEAVFIADGYATECCSSNLFIVARGSLLTHPVGPKVLPGITRLMLLELARRLDIAAIERPISEAEALAADEVFITSTTREIGWVGQWNGRRIGQGRCGPVTSRLHELLRQAIAEGTA